MELFPTAEAVFSKFAETSIDSPRRRKQFLALLKYAGITKFAAANRRQLIALAESGVNPFDRHSVPNNFSGIYPELSFSILLDRSGDTLLHRAAKLVTAALAFRQALFAGTLDRETVGTVAVDYDRRRHMFGRVANVKRTGLQWSKEIRQCDSSNHIVVAVNGHYYRLDVIDGDAMPKSPEVIMRGLEAILRAAAGENHRRQYGIITTNITKRSADVFYSNPLDGSIKTIDEAIFLLALDTDRAPADENEAARDIHINNYHNRDYRKSLQLVVLQNGFSGLTCSLFAEIEGVPAVRFASWIDSYAKTMPPLAVARQENGVAELRFETIDFSVFPIRKLMKKIEKYTCDVPLIRRIDVIGKDAIKELNVSPDAFFHAAAHLAYYDAFGRIPWMQNLADMRAVKFGSITRYPSTTAELAAFLRNQSRQALIEALQAHKQRIAVIKSGDFPPHYIFYYLFSSVGFKPLIGIVLFALFVPDLFHKYISPDIWASNIPDLPGVYCAGRFGVYFKMARRNCLAGNYLLCADHIKVCFPSNERSFLDTWQFDRALAAAMIKLRRILSE